jgi:hypothetical protein
VKAIISACGLKVTKTGSYGQYVFATKGYAISGELCQNFPFLATIIYYYYEVTLITPIE